MLWHHIFNVKMYQKMLMSTLRDTYTLLFDKQSYKFVILSEKWWKFNCFGQKLVTACYVTLVFYVIHSAKLNICVPVIVFFISWYVCQQGLVNSRLLSLDHVAMTSQKLVWQLSTDQALSVDNECLMWGTSTCTCTYHDNEQHNHVLHYMSRYYF
jgi:hypothetical protein